MARAPCAALAQPPSVMIDGERLPAHVPALALGDHVLVPLRGVFERFGANVSFDDKDQAAVAVLRDRTVKVSLLGPDAWINGEHRRLDLGAREVAGRTLIPLRFVAEALGVSVDYDARSNTVVIVSGFRSGSFAAATNVASTETGSGSLSIASAIKRAPSVEEQSPHQDELIGSQYAQIYARFKGGSSAVNPSTVTLNVDGQDVTAASTVSSAYVAYTPQYGLPTGQHRVEISGAADDGTPFAAGWSFRVDAGNSALYMNGGDMGSGPYFNGFNAFWFPRYRFFPPGFSVFTPGPLFFDRDDVVEVIFFNRFFTAGNGFFSVTGIPGNFALTPWPGNPGFFWGFTRVPFGATAHHAIISAHFALPNGRSVVVHSTAPLDIDGTRRSLPHSLRYAVLPQVIGRPLSPHQLVVFRRIDETGVEDLAGSGVSHLRVIRGSNGAITIRSDPGIAWSRRAPLVHAVAPVAATVPGRRGAPVMRAYPVLPIGAYGRLPVVPAPRLGVSPPVLHAPVPAPMPVSAPPPPAPVVVPVRIPVPVAPPPVKPLPPQPGPKPKPKQP
ncbi:MAG: copper amine oxidase N-terminal domain-containing protein [Candidatus Eremiobacteraeota bacterium]|nr:copper amine oxidase N-terminal domain-containing protein [Candidatus Eremiobacteraeota bacterium]